MGKLSALGEWKSRGVENGEHVVFEISVFLDEKLPLLEDLVMLGLADIFGDLERGSVAAIEVVVIQGHGRVVGCSRIN